MEPQRGKPVPADDIEVEDADHQDNWEADGEEISNLPLPIPNPNTEGMDPVDESEEGGSILIGEEDRGMVNFLTRELPEGEFEVIAHVQADPNKSFEQAAIYIFENEDNYIALNLGFCGICGVGRPGYFMETFIDNNPFGDFYEIPRDAATTEVSLKLANQDDSIIGYYALPGDEWQRLGAFGHYFEFNSVGMGATNSNLDGVESDIVARFDYFEIRKP